MADASLSKIFKCDENNMFISVIGEIFPILLKKANENLIAALPIEQNTGGNSTMSSPCCGINEKTKKETRHTKNVICQEPEV
ncbi:hypothetical protein HYV84_01595 [Candidatus Woesearchaeota archaeon]|nr:hypothetical protein [Candidatus Woesearchaeota archaeon]